MGLFDKRAIKGQKDDFDSPVEQVDLSELSPPAIAPAQAVLSGGGRPPAPPVASESRDAPDFGIQKAIELMRTLPVGSVELVVQVVKLTLESARIQIGTIIDDATARQDRIRARVSSLTAAIAELEQEIAQRKDEIGKLEADYAETSLVKDRLQLAEKLTQGGQPAAPSAPPVAAASKPTATDASWTDVSLSSVETSGPWPLPGGTPRAPAAATATWEGTGPAGAEARAAGGTGGHGRK